MIGNSFGVKGFRVKLHGVEEKNAYHKTRMVMKCTWFVPTNGSLFLYRVPV
jgi:hypothetical protein